MGNRLKISGLVLQIVLFSLLTYNSQTAISHSHAKNPEQAKIQKIQNADDADFCIVCELASAGIIGFARVQFVQSACEFHASILFILPAVHSLELGSEHSGRAPPLV